MDAHPPKRERATLADLLAMPEDGRYEIVNGQLSPKPGASGKKGRALAKVAAVLAPYHRRLHASPERPGGFWFLSGALVELGDGQMRRPDLAGWRRERLAEVPEEVPIKVLPDWICEISSSNRSNDLIRKKRLYHRCEIPHYWILDPSEETLIVHRWTAEGYVEVLSAFKNERVRAAPFEAIESLVGAFFGDDGE